MKRPTERQSDILRTVSALRAELGRPATVSELARRLDISRQNMREHVWRLRELGYLNFKAQDRQSLAPVLTERARALLAAPGHAVLGSIAAGEPIHAAEQLEGYTERLADLLPLHEGDFLLKVEGDSMIGAGYLPGDYVVVRPDQEVLDGDVVVAFLPDDESATLKRYYRQDDDVLLVSENARYAPIRRRLPLVRVQGVVVGHVGQRRGRRPLRELLRRDG